MRVGTLRLAGGVCALAAALMSAAAIRAVESGAVLDTFDFRKEAAVPVRLPRALREVSGLAVTTDGRVFGHGDERGIIFQVDHQSGTIVKWFALGSPAVFDDLEGLAVVDERLFLVTSRGRLYETREGENGVAMPYTSFDTGFGAQCELEGLAYEPSDRSLIIGCKRPYDPALRGLVTLFRWSIDRRAPSTPSRISIPVGEIVRGTEVKGFHPSAVEREPRTGHYVVVAGPQHVIAELTPAGGVVATRVLSGRAHQQPEGVTFLGDSAVLIADEGGTGRGRLTMYPRVRE